MRKSISPLGETEIEVLNHVWDFGEATVKDVLSRVRKDRDVAYTTIMTVMKNLAEKGYLTYRKDGVTYVYRALEKPEEVRSNLVNNLISKVFKGSPSELVKTLVRSEDLTEDEISQIKNMIDNMED